MILHIFNPEHDLALAANLFNFTPPEAARRMRVGLEFLPALWAREGDAVLVTDKQYSLDMTRRVREESCQQTKDRCEFVTHTDLCHLNITGAEPWGWDIAIAHELLRNGVDTSLLPDTVRLEEIRALSSRVTAAHLLPALTGAGRSGEAFVCYEEAEILEKLSCLHDIVIKSPWSCSGRGLRFVHNGNVTASTRGWIKNTLKMQGCAIVEPYYNKVIDFGMEFFCDKDGNVTYSGLSLFEASNGAYTGNLLASESYKHEILNRYISTDLLNDVKEKICAEAGRLYKNKYAGPFGVDMMIISHSGHGDYMLHPCVEINLRRTMGHVALSLSPMTGTEAGVMRIVTKGNNYKFKIQTL